MTKRKLPSCVTAKGKKYLANVMFKGLRLSKEFADLGDADLIKANIKWALKTAHSQGGDNALAKEIYDNPEVYKVAQPSTHELTQTSTALRKKEWTMADAYKAVKQYWDINEADKTNYIKARLVVKYFKPSTKLSKIDTAAIKNYVHHLKTKERNAESTIRKNIAALSKMLHIAYEEEHLLRLPVFNRPKEAEPAIRWIGMNDPKAEAKITQLLTQWGKLDHVDVFHSLLDSGMRQKELFSFKEKQVLFNFVDPATGEAFPAIMLTAKQTKNKMPRSVPITKRFHRILEKRMTGNPDYIVFPYRLQWFRNQWDKVRQRLGKSFEDSEFSPHICRHTFASKLVMNGTTLPVLKELGGWKTLSQVQRYAHLAPTSLLAATKILDRLNSEMYLQPVGLLQPVGGNVGTRGGQ